MIDSCPLNVALKHEQYHLKIFEDMLPDLVDAKVFTNMDLYSGYWHAVLDEGASEPHPIPDTL